MIKNKKTAIKKSKVNKNSLFFFFYFLTLIAVFNVQIIKNFTNAFKMLVGKINYWFVFSENGEVVPLPPITNPEVPLPNFPDPELEIPITTWGYWREVINTIIRGLIIFGIVLALIWIFIFILKRLEVRSKRQTTFFYLLYTKTLQAPLKRFLNRLNQLVASIMLKVLNKQTLTIMILMALAISGVLFQLMVGLLVSVYSLFLTGPFNWLWLHFKAIMYYLVVFLSKFTAFNIFITLFMLYVIVAFAFAYKEIKKNELDQEKFVDNMSFGVGVAGGSGKGKSLIAKVLSDAAQRSAKKFVIKDNRDTENAYSGVVSFSDMRRFFDKHKDQIFDDIDAENYAKRFIEEYRVCNVRIDRFLGQTPDLHEQIRWYFIGKWMVKPETRLIMSAIPTIINDPSSSKEIRNSIYDILTMRREDIFSIKLDQNLIKSALDNIESEIDKKGERIFKLKEGVKPSDINLSAFPGLTVLWPELDKDFPFNDRSQILEAKIDKLLGIFRHFTAFKQKTIGHFIYDSQQRDGVANIVRTKFDSVLTIRQQDKGKRSLFLIPFIKYFEKQLTLFNRILDAMIQGAPYKKSFFRIFIEWQARSLKRVSDYLHSFDFIDLHVVLTDASGVMINDRGKSSNRLRINLANAYFTFPSVVYQDPYKEAKERFPAVRTVKDLKPWNSLKMNLDDIGEMNSAFLKEVFLGEKQKDNKKKGSKNKSKDKPDETEKKTGFEELL